MDCGSALDRYRDATQRRATPPGEFGQSYLSQWANAVKNRSIYTHERGDRGPMAESPRFASCFALKHHVFARHEAA
ncbi:conserved hypothetical protein [Ralstonia solanacearum K60]|nr:conserved hypothetical protein [Ralstonia solanacearum K60]